MYFTIAEGRRSKGLVAPTTQSAPRGGTTKNTCAHKALGDTQHLYDGSVSTDLQHLTGADFAVTQRNVHNLGITRRLEAGAAAATDI